jgi:hypothetical protein
VKRQHGARLFGEVNNMPDVNLIELFAGMQEQMATTLKLHTKVTEHPVEKGDATEINWHEWLTTYLPKRYRADKAFIVDCRGKKSEQIDLVIYDQQYSPFVFNQSGILYIPSESVYAVFEVKPTINKQTLTYAGNKAKSVRQLHRTSFSIIHAGGSYAPKPPHRILSGILTANSDWKEPIGKTLDKNLFALDDESKIDIGCVLNAGAFLSNHTNSVIEKSGASESLIFFFLKLLIELQKIGTVPAMDIEEYLNIITTTK